MLYKVAVIDTGYGDAGKGAFVDWLCMQLPVPLVVRYSGVIRPAIL